MIAHKATSKRRSFVTIVAFSASLWLALTSFVAAEVIERFEADLVVRPTGEVTVTETIVYDFESADRHGIYRDLEASHPQQSASWFKDRYIDYELVSVRRDGVTEQYVVEDGAGLSVRIGDPSVTITGQHTYEIIYVVEGSIASYETGNELYWNVTGSQWSVPIKEIEVRVTPAAGVTLLGQQACYVGQRGESNRCKEAALNAQMAIFSHGQLAAGEGITVAQRISLPQSSIVLERYNWLLIFVIITVAWSVVWIAWLWRWRLHYRRSQPIITQYEPYEEFKPMFTGVLFDNRLDSRDITAGIVYLAEQGFLHITQQSKKVLGFFESEDYEIRLERPLGELSLPSHQELLSLLDLTTIGQTTKLSELKKDQSQLRKNAKTIEALRKVLVSDLIEKGFLEQRLKRATRIGIVIALIVIATNAFAFIGAVVGLAVVAVLGLGAVTFLFWLLFGVERRTTKGYEAMYYLKGFKDFLSTTEKERYKFHNAPAKNTDQFMEYLPYAIAFGVEKEWAEVFKDIQVEAPSWYTSTSHTSFSAAVLTSEMNSFSSALATSTVTSGNSGSGGGGFSGGGAGGGGGGSW